MTQTKKKFILSSLSVVVVLVVHACFSFTKWKTEVAIILNQRLSGDPSPLFMTNSTKTILNSTTTITTPPLDDVATLMTMFRDNACKTLSETVLRVGSKLQDPHKVASRPSWIPPVLSCDKLQRGLPRQYWWLPPAASQQQSSSSNPYLKRLLALISRLERGEEPIKIVILGGSMTAGHRDDLIEGAGKEGAWPHKLKMLINQMWPSDVVTVENHAQGGVSETFWLENFHLVKRMEPFDLLIGEWAVNDQCDYEQKEQFASIFNWTSHSLINEILWLPSNPAVLSIELFRTAYNDVSDANGHCQDHKKITKDLSWVRPARSFYSSTMQLHAQRTPPPTTDSHLHFF